MNPFSKEPRDGEQTLLDEARKEINEVDAAMAELTAKLQEWEG